MKTINVLAVDYGASEGKAVLAAFDGKRLTCSEVHRFENYACRIFSNMYWDILMLFEELKKALSNAVKISGDITGLGIDSWASDFGVLDSQGNLLGNPNSYLSDRTLAIVDDVYDIYSSYELFKMTGIEPHFRFGLFNLYSTQNQISALAKDIEYDIVIFGILLSFS